MRRTRCWVNTSSKPDRVCKVCGGPSTPKHMYGRGINICVNCIENVPTYIPNAQLGKYLKIKFFI